jgi:hypothetical protein
VSAYAYDPGGRVERGDLEITATDRRALVNTSIILHPTVTYAEQQEARLQAGNRSLPANEVVVSTDYLGDDVSTELRELVIGQRRDTDTDGGTRETYHRIEVSDALRMLHIRSEPTVH